MREPPDERMAADERPQVRVERTELPLDLAHASRVVHRGLDLEPVANDARSWSRRSTFAGVKRATFAGSNPANALRYPSLLFKIVDQGGARLGALEAEHLEQAASSWTGTPHSSSWYARTGWSSGTHSQRFGIGSNASIGHRHGHTVVVEAWARGSRRSAARGRRDAEALAREHGDARVRLRPRPDRGSGAVAGGRVRERGASRSGSGSP